MRYRRRPLEVDAFRWMADDPPAWFIEERRGWRPLFEGRYELETCEGLEQVVAGDWIMRMSDGAIWVVEHEVFLRAFEPAPACAALAIAAQPLTPGPTTSSGEEVAG